MTGTDTFPTLPVRARFEHVEPSAQLSWAIFRCAAQRYDYAWHFHREFELTLITEGTGTRFVGDCIEDYAPGDLVLTGPELPHTYISAPGHHPQRAIVVQFRSDFLGDGFFHRPEFATLAALLRRAGRGLLFPGAPVVPALHTLDRLPPARRTLRLLDILAELAEQHGGRTLSGARMVPRLDGAARDRIEAMIAFLQTGYAERITLDDVAGAVHLTPAAASRFFRGATGTTVTGYLNRVRVAAACHLLADTGLPITDIAARCGYQNLSNFNRRFLALRSMPPRAYRARFAADPAGMC